MKHLYTVLIIFLSLTCDAQYYHSKISLTNGQNKEGYAQLPTNDIFYDEIGFKENIDQKSTTIKNDEIEKITYYTENGIEYHFERKPVRQFFGKREKTTKHKTWLIVIFSSPNITYYNEAKRYSINKEGHLISQSAMSYFFGEIPLLFRRPDETVSTVICTQTSGNTTIIGKEKKFRKNAIRYFSGEDSFIKRIDAKEFKSENMLELAKAYTEFKQE